MMGSRPYGGLKTTGAGIFTEQGQMVRTMLFLANRSQAVRLPKDVAFPPGVREVAVLRKGTPRVIIAKRRREVANFAGRLTGLAFHEAAAGRAVGRPLNHPRESLGATVCSLQ